MTRRQVDLWVGGPVLPEIRSRGPGSGLCTEPGSGVISLALP